MKKIKDIIKAKKAVSFHQGYKNMTGLEGKYIEKLFYDIVNDLTGNITRADIARINLKEKVVYVKANHPGVASDLWRRREKILALMNDELGVDEIIRIVIQ